LLVAGASRSRRLMRFLGVSHQAEHRTGRGRSPHVGIELSIRRTRLYPVSRPPWLGEVFLKPVDAVTSRRPVQLLSHSAAVESGFG
jgi:hypothetical protein